MTEAVPVRRRCVWLWILLITLLAAALRFWRIGAQSLWDDEVATLRAAALTLRQIWTIIPTIDSNPPLIYTVLHFWRYFGDSEFALRALPALAGTLGAPAAYLALRRLIGRGAALLAALLLAINPLAVYCGQETRYNTLVTLFSLLAVWALLGLLETGRRRYAPVLFVFATLAIYSHYFSFFVMAAMVVWLTIAAAALWRRGRRDAPALGRLALIGLYTRSARLRGESAAALAAYIEVWRARWRGIGWSCLALLGAGLAFVPFLKYFTLQFLRGAPWREPSSLGEALRRAAIWPLIGHSVTMPPTFFAGIGPWATRHETAYQWLLLAFVAPALATAVYGLIARETSTRRAALAVFVGAPLLGLAAASRLMPIFDPRYLLPFLPFLLGALAAGWRALWVNQRRAAAVALALWLLPLTGLSLKDYYYSPAHARQDWRGLAQRIAAEAEPNAVVLCYNFYTSLAFLHYFEKSPRRPPVEFLYVLEERDGPPDAKQRRVAQVLDNAARMRRPVWLIDYHGRMDDPNDDVRHGLDERGYFRKTQECRLPGLWRYCLDRWVGGGDG